MIPYTRVRNMRDFPVFTTDNGVASLVLREIPYTKSAYITVQDSLSPDKLVAECVDFCKAVGAEQIYASNHPYLEQFPFHTAILQMTADRDGLAEADAAIFPVTEQTAERWREIYNDRMKSVANFSYMSRADMDKLIKEGGGYFVHQNNELLGIGMAAGDTIQTVISVKHGAGATVLLALNHALSGEQVLLEVVSTNEKAIALYERMGFIVAREKCRWYQVL